MNVLPSQKDEADYRRAPTIATDDESDNYYAAHLRVQVLVCLYANFNVLLRSYFSPIPYII
jgi:hypothetical protein